MWVAHAEFLMRSSTAIKAGEARLLLDKAVKALPKHKHIKTICKFAVNEFKMKRGSAERGRTIFEGVLANYPKRSDVWHIYIDQEIRLKELGGKRVRSLLERALTSKWSTKKMKAFFKKYLTFEQAHGTPNHVEHVKGLARAYVESEADRQVARMEDGSDSN